MLKRKLILGAAGCIAPEAIKVDIESRYQPDIVCDLNIVPWPFKDNQFEEIICHHVIEHLDGLPKVMKELYRICKSEGRIYIEVPHYSSWFANDPEHKMRFSYFSLDPYIDKGKKTWMIVDYKFHLLRRQVTFHRAYRRYQLHRLINRFPQAYERFWAYIIPAENMIWELQPIKFTDKVKP